MAETLERVVMLLTEEIRNMWRVPPKEIAVLRKTVGAMNNHGLVMLFIDGESKAMVEDLWCLWKIGKDRSVDLASLKTITKAILERKISKWPGYYKIEKTPGLFREIVSAIDQVQHFEEYTRLTELALQYVNIWNYYIDLQIPWARVADAYDRAIRPSARKPVGVHDRS